MNLPPLQSGEVLAAEDGAVLTLTLNRPASFNALSEEMLEALGGELDRLADDAHVRCVVIAAEGRAFRLRMEEADAKKSSKDGDDDGDTKTHCIFDVDNHIYCASF